MNRCQTKPLVSIIVPMYNPGKYFRPCLESIHSQTLQELEIIIVDDCSPDNSIETALEFEAKDSRFKVLRNEKNLGQGASRDVGVAIASGEFVGFVDDDDTISPDMYEILYTRAKKYDADVSAGVVKVVRPNGFSSVNPHPGKVTFAKGEEFLHSMFKSVSDPHVLPNIEFSEWNKIIRRSLIRGNALQHLAGRRLGEDEHFIGCVIASAEKIVSNPEVCYFYNRKNNQATSKSVNLEFTFSTFQSFVSLHDFLREKAFWNNDFEDRFYRYMGQHLYLRIVNSFSLLDDAYNRKMLCFFAEQLTRLDSRMIEDCQYEPYAKIVYNCLLHPENPLYRARIKWQKLKMNYVPTSLYNIIAKYRRNA